MWTAPRSVRRARLAAGALCVVAPLLVLSSSSPSGGSARLLDPACAERVAQLEDGEGVWCVHVPQGEEAQRLSERADEGHR